MALQVRFISRLEGRSVLALCDENGKILPGQQNLVISQKLNDVTIVTVDFVVGNDVKLVGGE